jgi:hypothetical protein
MAERGIVRNCCGEVVRCTFCGSDNVGKFGAEIAIHFLGLKNINKPHVYTSADLVVCLNCGTAQIAIPEPQLGQLAKGAAAAIS